MLITNIIITFKGESFTIEESTSSETEFLELFNTTSADVLFISIFQRDFAEKDTPPIVTYKLYDTRAKKELYGKYTSIITNAQGKKPPEIFQLGNNCNMNTFGLILRRDPKKISLVVKKIEKKYVQYYNDEKSIFTDHPDNTMFHFGLPLLLALKGVEDRQPTAI